MAKKEGIESRLIFVLVLIMIVSGVSLAGLYQWTIPHIEAHEALARERAIFSVLPRANAYEAIETDELLVYRGLDEAQNQVGYAMETRGGGFQGMITLMVGLDPEAGELTGIEVLTMFETPGLGARIDEVNFKEQFTDKQFGDPFKAGEDIDSISGATLSVQAVGNIVSAAITQFEALKLDSPGGE